MIGPRSKSSVGVRFGRLIVIDQFSKVNSSGNLVSHAVCKCDCGRIKTIRVNALRNEDTRSCGCIKKEFHSYESLVGRKYSRLSVISHYPYFQCGCLCECGEITFVNPSDLRRGRYRSCGCLLKDLHCLRGVVRGIRDTLTGRPAPNRDERTCTQYKNWRQAVLERDGKICQICGGPGSVTDHIKRFRDFPELRLEVSNGRCLCLVCHRKTPTYGNRKQTELERRTHS